MSKPTNTDPPSPAPHVADSHDLIRVLGARVNNLKDVSIEIPKRRLTSRAYLLRFGLWRPVRKFFAFMVYGYARASPSTR